VKAGHEPSQSWAASGEQACVPFEAPLRARTDFQELIRMLRAIK